LVSLEVTYVYAYTLLELLLDIGAVYFAYRLTRITGAFRGWVLMIAAVVLITFQSTSSILTLALFFPESQLESLIQSIGTGTFIVSSLIGMLVSITLFLAMFELFRTFNRVKATQQS
jgi:hypothetical protein